ncbi:hypothetical protein DJ82_11920 [Halorubrum sp. Ib24]|uniref:hypothetical protein n=1 Tax=unclassified Halorubrum TaxID=2642239 RepID=UPI000B99166E|nr:MULTISPECIES: hypothetical protein [unclassified Halorubrum]OYR38504.1 hypothetical protein DJ82_11920 [Halorubrum sp. Ib24]OYR45098.1 hypothetical protein DJ81_05880 [Halorubrum sp. Hd13]OYR48719.1 hypothetical protein DJ73_19050 [Halorubrum sp. Ea1]OYR50841.1 hypothetical protein DJ74_05260 [Halorubrum sp. Ea8]
MSDDIDESVAVLNVRSVVGIVVCFVVAAGALFALPTLQNQGLEFSTAFWLISAVELVTALGIAYFVLNLHEERA